MSGVSDTAGLLKLLRQPKAQEPNHLNHLNHLYVRQYAYQTGKSVDTALAKAITFVKKGMKNPGIVLAGLLT